MDYEEQVLTILGEMRKERNLLIALLTSLMLDTGKYDYSMPITLLEDITDYALKYYVDRDVDGNVNRFVAEIMFPEEKNNE